MAYKYSWTKTFPVPAQIVGEFFYSLPERTPEAFISASKNKKAPTHALFEWDDSAAAREFRLVQARVIVSSLQVEIVTPTGKVDRVRAYIGTSDRGRYSATLEATEEELSEAEQRCLAQMRTFRDRWKSLQLAQDVVSAIAQTEQKVRRRKMKKAA
jgi:hypothetical protein